MTQTVRGVISRKKSEPVEVVDIVIPDPGPGEVVVDMARATETGEMEDDLRTFVEVILLKSCSTRSTVESVSIAPSLKNLASLPLRSGISLHHLVQDAESCARGR